MKERFQGLADTAWLVDWRVAGRDAAGISEGGCSANLIQMLLDQFKALGIPFEQATWDHKKGQAGKSEKRALTLADIEALHPFHWGYEFDKVIAA